MTITDTQPAHTDPETTGELHTMSDVGTEESDSPATDCVTSSAPSSRRWVSCHSPTPAPWSWA